MHQNSQSNTVWEDKLTWFKSPPECRTLDKIDGEPMEFEWNIFSGFSTSQLCHTVQELLSRLSVEPEEFHWTDYLHVDVERHLIGSQDNEQECELSAQLVSIYARRFSPGRWSFFGPGPEKKCYSTRDSRPQGEWDRVAELMMIKFGESGHPVFRATSPLSRGTLKSKGGGKSSIHFCADGETVENCFSHNYFRRSAQYTPTEYLCRINSGKKNCSCINK